MNPDAGGRLRVEDFFPPIQQTPERAAAALVQLRSHIEGRRTIRVGGDQGAAAHRDRVLDVWERGRHLVRCYDDLLAPVPTMPTGVCDQYTELSAIDVLIAWVNAEQRCLCSPRLHVPDEEPAVAEVTVVPVVRPDGPTGGGHFWYCGVRHEFASSGEGRLAKLLGIMWPHFPDRAISLQTFRREWDDLDMLPKSVKNRIKELNPVLENRFGFSHILDYFQDEGGWVRWIARDAAETA